MRIAAAFLVVPRRFWPSLASAIAQRPGAFGGARDHPAIAYSTRPSTIRVAQLNKKLVDGR
jgi:hypothetical protein